MPPSFSPLVHSVYSAPSSLFVQGRSIQSAEGVQQGDPLGPLLFSLTTMGLIKPLRSELVIFYLEEGLGCSPCGSCTQGTSGSGSGRVYPSSPLGGQQERGRGLAAGPPSVISRLTYGGRRLPCGHWTAPGYTIVSASQVPAMWDASGLSGYPRPTLLDECGTSL